MADQVKPEVAILGDIGPGTSYFDPLAFRAVTEPRFGNAGYNSMRGPGFANFDFSIHRQFSFNDRWKVQVRAEVFNLTNTPHLANPSGNGLNVSNLQLNPDGSIRNLGGFSSITSTANSGRDGIDERVIRFGVRLGFQEGSEVAEAAEPEFNAELAELAEFLSIFLSVLRDLRV